MPELYVNQVAAADKAKRLVWLVFLTIVITIVWATFATLEEAVVGQGKVVPAQAVQSVENIDGGILQALLVNEGEQVSQGQKLILLEDIRFSAALNESAQEQLSLRLKKLRLSAELKSIAIEQGSVTVLAQSFQHTDLAELDKLQVGYSYESRLTQLLSLIHI